MNIDPNELRVKTILLDIIGYIWLFQSWFCLLVYPIMLIILAIREPNLSLSYLSFLLISLLLAGIGRLNAKFLISHSKIALVFNGLGLIGTAYFLIFMVINVNIPVIQKISFVTMTFMAVILVITCFINLFVNRENIRSDNEN